MSYELIISQLTVLTNDKHLAILFGALIGILYVLYVKNSNIFGITKKAGFIKIALFVCLLPIIVLIFILFMFDVGTPKQGLINGIGIIGLLADTKINDDFFKERI